MTELNLQNSRVEKAHDRLDAVEERVGKLELSDAVTGVRMTNIQSSLTKIEGMTGWVLKIVLGGIVAAVVTFIIRGGLNVQ